MGATLTIQDFSFLTNGKPCSTVNGGVCIGTKNDLPSMKGKPNCGDLIVLEKNPKCGNKEYRKIT